MVLGSRLASVLLVLASGSRLCGVLWVLASGLCALGCRFLALALGSVLCS